MPGPLEDLVLRTIDRRLIDRLLGLRVSGIEVTQAIQYYDSSRHLTDAADQGADNSVTLVAGKPAWVRVYVRSGLLGGDIPGVTGTLEVKRRSGGLFYDTISTLNPQPPGTVTARNQLTYADERGILTNSLNFIIPADEMCGYLKLRVIVSSSDDSASREINLDVTLRQTLRLRGVMVGYNGPNSTAPNAPNLTIAAPAIADLQTTSQWALLTFPVQSAATYSSAGSITLTVPLSDAPSCAGCCTPNWVSLNAMVAAQVTADGNQSGVLYYGLIATGVPMGPIVGCESSGVSAGGVGDGVTLAHELGHHCGFPHAPCGNVGTPDATYPAYEPYDPANTPNASIGEYGLDISNGNIMAPSMFKDVMSYCWPKWISLHNYGNLIQNDQLDPGRSCVDHPWWRDIILYERPLIPEKWLPDPPPDWYFSEVDPQPWISIIGVMRSERELEITSVMRVETRPSLRGTRSTELTAALLGKDGQRIAEAPLRELRSHACDCGGGAAGDDADGFPRIVQALIPDVERGTALSIQRGDEELWSVSAPSRRPKVAALDARLKNEQLTVTWAVDADAEAPELWLQWSADRGKTWQALATGLAGKKAVIDVSHLPAGAIALRLLAGDGFHTTISKVARVTIPKRPPSVAILTPRDGQTLVAGGTMRLWAAVTPTPEDPDGLNARWLLDGEPVAEDLDAFVIAPPAGQHRLELEFESADGKGKATSSFETVAVEPRTDKEGGSSQRAS